MDGRVQLPVIEWLKSQYGVDYVDVITEPGPNKILACGPSSRTDAIRDRMLISVKVHGSRVVALAAHADCAGNPAPKEESLRQLQEGMKVIQSWDLPVTIIGLWVDSTDWLVEQVAVIDCSSASDQDTQDHR
jgi:hypothetical protein